MKHATLAVLCAVLWAGACGAADLRGHLETEDLPARWRDRGEGVPLSVFGTYIQKGQFLIYPFFEYYHNHDAEYAPADFGFVGTEDLRSKYTATEELLFLGYGFTDRLAFEMEAAIIQARLEKSPLDTSAMPSEIEADGLGDVEGQVRFRWAKETERRPEIFSYFEAVVPTQDEGSLIGTTDWEFKLGSGIIRGFSWGTMTLRASVAHDRAEKKTEIGEAALEYVRRLSSRWRLYGGVEGTQDEVELITEAQIHFSRRAFVKLNNSVGVTSKAADWAPEIGVLFGL